ncbi:DUF6114 domain-containing protein [Nonomuraea ferruginea]
MPDTRFRRWRRTRPFWGGLWVAAGGAVILLAPLAPLPLLVRQGGSPGSPAIWRGCFSSRPSLLSWWQHGQRVFLGVAAIALSLGSFVTSNLGGLGLGMLAGLTGGALLCAWSPDGRPAQRREEPLRVIAAVPVALVLALPAPHPSGPADSGLEAARLTLWGGRFEGVVS